MSYGLKVGRRQAILAIAVLGAAIVAPVGARAADPPPPDHWTCDRTVPGACPDFVASAGVSGGTIVNRFNDLRLEFSQPDRVMPVIKAEYYIPTGYRFALNEVPLPTFDNPADATCSNILGSDGGLKRATGISLATSLHANSNPVRGLRTGDDVDEAVDAVNPGSNAPVAPTNVYWGIQPQNNSSPQNNRPSVSLLSWDDTTARMCYHHKTPSAGDATTIDADFTLERLSDNPDFDWLVTFDMSKAFVGRTWWETEQASVRNFTLNLGAVTIPTRECQDGIDNDGDGLIDNADQRGCYFQSRTATGGYNNPTYAPLDSSEADHPFVDKNGNGDEDPGEWLPDRCADCGGPGLNGVGFARTPADPGHYEFETRLYSCRDGMTNGGNGCVGGAESDPIVQTKTITVAPPPAGPTVDYAKITGPLSSDLCTGTGCFLGLVHGTNDFTVTWNEPPPSGVEIDGYVLTMAQPNDQDGRYFRRIITDPSLSADPDFDASTCASGACSADFSFDGLVSYQGIPMRGDTKYHIVLTTIYDGGRRTDGLCDDPDGIGVPCDPSSPPLKVIDEVGENVLQLLHLEDQWQIGFVEVLNSSATNNYDPVYNRILVVDFDTKKARLIVWNNNPQIDVYAGTSSLTQGAAGSGGTISFGSNNPRSTNWRVDALYDPFSGVNGYFYEYWTGDPRIDNRGNVSINGWPHLYYNEAEQLSMGQLF
ncbi:MAG TPA: hypothetical protein VGB83_09635 [Actinomycetota bacterium]